MTQEELDALAQQEFDALEDDAPEVSGGSVRRRSLVAVSGLALLAGGAALAWLSAFGDAAEAPAVVADAPTIADAPPSDSGVRAVTDVADVALPDLRAGPIRTAALATVPNRSPAAPRPAIAATDCSVSVDAMPLAGALVALDISAPCDAAGRVDILQGDLHVAVALDDSGRAEIEIPALSAPATIAVVVADRAPATSTVPVVDFADYARAVLHWQGDAGLELHGFEGGAGYGSAGHVSPQTPRSIARALTGTGGFLMTLGDAALPDARMASVYTVPAGRPLDVSIEAPVLARNCTRDIVAGTILAADGAAVTATDLAFTMPACDAIGDYVVLGGLAPGLTLAAN